MTASDDNPYGASQASYQQTTLIGGNVAPAAAPEALVIDVTTQSFGDDVIKRSQNVPVIVDFWAPWCGPCKQLTPVLEKLVAAHGGNVILAKMNIDEHPSIAGQMGVQSIPAVVAFVGGQPADAFMGAVPESEAKAFIDKIAKLGGRDRADPLAEMIELGKAALEEGRYEEAGQFYSAIVQAQPQNIIGLAGLAECLFEIGRVDEANQVLETVPVDKRKDQIFVAIDAKMRLAAEVAALGDPAALEARLDKDANDHQARFDLAVIYNVRGDREKAADHLLYIMRKDRTWQDDGARLRLLQLFDAWGPMDAATLSARRQLSSLLFS